jgi:O-antigen ligase
MNLLKYFIFNLTVFFIIFSILVLIFINEYNIIKTILTTILFAFIMTVYKHAVNQYKKKRKRRR